MRKNKSALISVIKQLTAPGCTMSIASAALVCGYSQVQVRKVLRNYRIYGDSAFIHRNSGRKPSTSIPLNVRRKIVSLYKEKFEGYNFTFFAKMLRELYEIFCSDKTVYNILSNAGIKSPENRKEKKEIVHRTRPRRAHEGELLQIDATPYQWFLWCGDDKYYSLHGSIDDATGKITALYACENECLFGYAELVRRTFFNYPNGGHPSAIYSDRAAIFCVSPKDKENMTIQDQLKGLHEKKTQWQRMMDELHVQQILAWSPQAKGRVERMWKTIQGRLPWYLEHYGIKTLDKLNEFLLEYVKIFNDEFSVEPAEKFPVWHKTGLDPDYVLCARYERTLRQNEFFSFEGYRWKIKNVRMRKCKFELCVNEHGIKAFKDGNFYDVELADDFYGETTTQVLEAIIYKYYLKDMKEMAA